MCSKMVKQVWIKVSDLFWAQSPVPDLSENHCPGRCPVISCVCNQLAE